jgi:hAT family C-terminal dimerisation region
LNHNRSNRRFALLRDLEKDDDSQMQTNMNELVNYYLGSMKPDNIDIFGYWKRNKTVYPTLAMTARDIFVTPVSTVPFESCFSSTNKILTDKRSRLDAKIFERLVCLKDWFDTEQRNQHDLWYMNPDGDSDDIPENDL